MSSYSVSVGEKRRLANTNQPGVNYLLVVEDEPVTVSARREYVSEGQAIEAGDRATVAVPPDAELWAYGAGTGGATVKVYPNGTNGLGEDSSVRISYQARSEVTVSGTATVDVTDRTGRDLGKTRLMDSGGSLIDAANPFPVDLQAANAGNIPVDLAADSLAGDLDVNLATDSLVGNLDVDLAEASAGQLNTATPNQANLAFGAESVATAGTAEPLNGGTSQAVPDGYAVAIQGVVASSGDSVYVGDSTVSAADGYPLADGQVVTLHPTDVATVHVDADTAGDGVRWIVEVA